MNDSVTSTPVPRVSVVMATYNMAAYVAAAARSVLDQTMGDLELIIVDDGSTDGTAAALSEVRRDPRVTFISQPNGGQTPAKNRGAQAARGTFLGFCDADDRWLPNKLSLQLPLFERDDGVGVVYGRTCFVDEFDKPLPAPHVDLYRGNVTRQLFYENFVPFGSALVRRAVVRHSPLFDPDLKMGIDWKLWLQISAIARFDYVDEPIYEYRIWPGQMSKNWRGRYEACFRTMEEFRRSYPGLIDAATWRRAMVSSYVNRARARSDISGDHVGGLADCARALRLAPSELSAWKTAARSALRAVRLAQS